MIDSAFSKAGVSLGDVDVFAFGAGPGSFTGLRIACGIAQGLAYGKRKRVVAVGNLRALAANAFAASTSGDLLLAAIDARMNEAYCAIYRRDRQVSEVERRRSSGRNRWRSLPLRENVDIVAGNALAAFSDGLAARKFLDHHARCHVLGGFDCNPGALRRGARTHTAPEQAAPDLRARSCRTLTIEERRKVA